MHQREAGVPIVRAFSPRQSWKFRHQRAVCVTAFHGHDRADAEDVPPFNEPAAGVGQVVTQRHGIAWLDSQVIGEPIVDQDFVVAQIRWNIGWFHRRHHRVRSGAIVGLKEVNEVSQDADPVGNDAACRQVVRAIVAGQLMIGQEPRAR